MKDALEISSVLVDLKAADGDGTLGQWAWPQVVPRTGETIEHDGRDYEVTAVRWSTDGPRQVEVRVRVSGEVGA